MVHTLYFSLAIFLAAFLSTAAIDVSAYDGYSLAPRDRDTAFRMRSDISDIIDNSPNIKALVAPYNDLVDPLIQRADSVLKRRGFEELGRRSRTQLAIRQLTLHSLARRIAGAGAEAEAGAEPETEGKLEALYMRDAAPNIFTNVYQGNMDSASSSNNRREASSEANIYTNVFQENMESSHKNDKREPEAGRHAEPEADIHTNVFQENMDGSRKNSRREARPESEVEAEADLEASIYTNVF